MKDGELHSCLGGSRTSPMQSEPGLFPLLDLPLSQAVPTVSFPWGKAHFAQRAKALRQIQTQLFLSLSQTSLPNTLVHKAPYHLMSLKQF